MAVPEAAATVPGAGAVATPANVAPAMSKAAMPAAQAAMGPAPVSATTPLPAATATISSKRGRRKQQHTRNRGRKRESAYHRASSYRNHATNAYCLAAEPDLNAPHAAAEESDFVTVSIGSEVEF